MKKRCDVGDLSFTEKELEELADQEENERRAQSGEPYLPPAPESEAQLSLLTSWFRSVRSRKNHAPLS